MSKWLQDPTLLINLDNVMIVNSVTNPLAITYTLVGGGTVTDNYGTHAEQQQALGQIIAFMNGKTTYALLLAPIAPSALSIASISPASGSYLVGIAATIVGGGFTKTPRLHVAVGGQEVPVVNVTDDTHANIQILPSPTGAPLAAQPVDVWYDYDGVAGGPSDHTLAAAFSWV